MSLFEELQKGPGAPLRVKDYLRWAVLVVLLAVALAAAVIMAILAVAGDNAAQVIEFVLHHVYIHYGLIPVLVVLLVVIVAAVAFVVQLAFTCIVYWKAYAGKRADNGTPADRPALLSKPESKTGWSKGYYQGVVLLATNALLVLLLVAGAVYTLGYIGIDVAEQPKFCTMCHEVMDKPYESYAASTHAGIACGECHNDPGVKGFVKGEVIAPIKEGWLQAAGDYHLDEHGHLLPSAVPINNDSCLSAECHKEERLRRETFRFGPYQFRHEKHLNLKHGGSPLTCDSCHAYDRKVHMKIDKAVCGLCHFSPLSNKFAGKEARCEGCHAERPRLKGETELMHREVADFAKQACNDCHEVEKSKLNLQADACGAKCHHRHGKEVMSAEGQNIHKIHKDAACMHCHAKADHKISSAKFNSKPLRVFDKKFTHEAHGDEKCSRCHAEKAGHFALALKSYADCSSCHHAEDKVAGVGSCDKCHKHEQPKIEAFGKKFSHKTHDGECKQCHVKGAKDLTLALKGRADCNACHHDGVDDPESCEGCHETQQELFSGEEKKEFGLKKMPHELYQDAEKECVTCHGEEVDRYEPSHARKTCIECHEDDPDYDCDKLVTKGRQAFKDAMAALKAAEYKHKATREKYVIKLEQAANDKKTRTALLTAHKMLDFLKSDGSFGLHNPGLFEAYLEKVDELLKKADKLLDEAVKGGK